MVAYKKNNMYLKFFVSLHLLQLHGAMVNGITIRVVHARKRPYDDNRYTWRAKGPRLGSSGELNLYYMS